MEKQKVTEITIPVPWGIIAGKAYGNEKNLPVLCCHGILDNCDAVSYLIPLLPKTFYYVCIDLPGHGKSSPSPPGLVLSLFEYTLAMIRVIDYMKWEELYCLGHSGGAVLSLVLAAMLPKHITKLILIDVYGFIIKDVLPHITERFESLLHLEKLLKMSKQSHYTLDEAVERVMSTRNTCITTDKVKNIIKRSLAKTDSNKFIFTNDQRLKLIPIVPYKDQMEVIITKDVHCPTLILQARHTDIKLDFFFFESKFFLDLLSVKKNVDIEYVDGDHDVHVTHPERLAKSITVFLLSHKSHL